MGFIKKMNNLILHGKDVESVFELLGTKENDITFSLSWCLANIKPFQSKFVENEDELTNLDIRLQEYGKGDKGFTDIELSSDKIFYIIEAKKGWNLPTKSQLNKYIGRFKEFDEVKNKIIVISECRKEYALKEIKEYNIDIPIEFISWREIHKWLDEVRMKCNLNQKNLIDQLDKYFSKVITMQDKDSNEVFCVVVSDKKLRGNFTFVDVVKKGYYFYPLKSGWPKDPPNYIAFRFKGKLLSIHHVDGYEIVELPDKHIPEIKGWKGWSRYHHFMLKLGKGFKPNHKVRNGGIYGSGHIKCDLDTLFICSTIKEAIDMTQKRKNKE